MTFKATSQIAQRSRLLFLPEIGCSRSLLPVQNILTQIYLTASLLLLATGSYASQLELSSDTEIATAGYFQLRWTGDKTEYQLQEATTSDFRDYKILYQGDDLATVISGKPDGKYFYRINEHKNQVDTFSNTVLVTVKHHSLTNALLFFIAGAIVFIATLAIILKGNRPQAS